MTPAMSSWRTHETVSISHTDNVAHSTERRRPPTDSSAYSGSTFVTTTPEGIHILEKRRPHRKERPLDSRLIPAVIPPEHSHRTLILCFDGTGDQFDNDNSNIVQLVSLLKKNDRSQQMVYYQTGIGTYTSPEVLTPLALKVSKTLDQMVAWNLDAHVMGGYEFLMQNYLDGDKICIFGFSRGAYTARSLAGMIHKVGLLPSDNHQQVPFAYKMYARTDHIGWEQSNAFKAAFSNDVEIEFLGVWDTVDSVGLTSKRLPFTTSNTIVRTFRHAVSLDERRAKFKVNLWNVPTAQERTLGLRKDNEGDIDTSPGTPASGGSHGHTKSSSFIERPSEEDQELSEFERLYAQKEKHKTDVDEVWFAGCHSDVGGGSVSNKTQNSLARISLRWMVRECFKTHTGIMFNSQALENIGLDPSTLFPYVIPRPPLRSISSENYECITKTPIMTKLACLFKRKDHSVDIPSTMTKNTKRASHPRVIDEEHEDLKDALTPIYDQLKITRIWWLLEILPLKMRYQNDEYEWISYLGMNLAQPRVIPRQANDGVKIHRSVKLRMEAHPPRGLKKKYKPRAPIHVDPIWVD